MTEHPTGAWTAQQVVEAFADREAAAQYLIRDHDSRYSAEVRLRILSMGIEEILTAPRSLRQKHDQRAKELAADNVRRREHLERDEDPGLCPYAYKLWARGTDGEFRVACQIEVR